jgi:hypothetical protein
VSRFGSIFEGLKTTRVIYLLCNFFFTIRRLLLILTAVMLSEHPAFQVMSFIFLSEITVIYIIQFKPYETRGTNLNEIFNECCVLVTSYTLIIFTEYVNDFSVRDFVGYCIIGCILLNFGVNLIIQLIHSFKSFKLIFRKMMNHPRCRRCKK